jgi:hypothetical protein
MTDGHVGPANELYTCMLLDDTMANPAWAVWTLGGAAHGYDVTSIQSLAGFNSQRPWQAMDVKYALVGETVTAGTELGHDLGTFTYQPSLAKSAGYGASQMTIADDSAARILSGISAIEIKFVNNGAYDNRNFTSYRELAIVGSPTLTPEPSTLAILVSALLGLLAYAWRKRR